MSDVNHEMVMIPFFMEGVHLIPSFAPIQSQANVYEETPFSNYGHQLKINFVKAY